MFSLLAVITKDLRLLWRDKVGLVFLVLAPIMVMTVAGFSLANLYGADPTGQTAYEFPLVDEDGGALGRSLREHLAHENAVDLRLFSSREEVEQRVRDKQAGTALVIPRGTDAALQHGEPAQLILYTDPVKYLERLNVRIRLLELRDQLTAERRAAALKEAQVQLDRAQADAGRVQDALEQARREADATYDRVRRTQADAIAQLQTAIERSQRDAEEQVRRAVDAGREQAARAIEQQVDQLRAPLRRYVQTLQDKRTEFERWLADLRRLAGSHAGDIPPPPSFPEIPAELAELAGDGALPLHLPTPGPFHLALPPAPKLVLPPLPTPPPIEVPQFTLPSLPVLPSGLEITETNLTGGPLHINTFDQNVPGFSVTFLLLGMLLGVSLGLLDERDWGTLERLQALPIAASTPLIGKLMARFAIGVVQMLLLLAVGWIAFGISLGPQPWALVVPTIGIVFAGCALGLVVGAVAATRESVMPVGSIIIVTMAAVGGCWWPIDLEPRWMRNVALAFPTTWAMDAYNDLMIRRRTIEVAVRPTAVMLAYGVLYLIIGVALFRRRMRRRTS